MFNISVKGNVRCNGIAQPGRGGMVRRNVHINNNAMPPNRGHSLSDTNKLKFSDRLKAYLSTDKIRQDSLSSASEIEDPYQFSDTEIVNNANKKCLDTTKLKQTHITDNGSGIVKNNKLTYILNGSNNISSGVGSVNSKCESNSASHGKTMNRLQAQIARNKVTVKHNRNSPDPKGLDSTPSKDTKRSIIGLVQSKEEGKLAASHKLQAPSGKPLPATLRARRASSKGTHHEGSVQRIRSSIADDRTWHAPTTNGTAIAPPEDPSSHARVISPVYQRHWFCRELEVLADIEGPREARLELTRIELKRHLVQMTANKYRRNKLDKEALTIVSKARTKAATPPQCNAAAIVGPASRSCSGEGCAKPALPCTSHCPLHIMNNSDQVLFNHCTAKFADNTQCSIPVFDIAHELPLCTEHARKRDNYNKMCLETKPKKARRKIKPSAMIRPQKRNKKRKRPQGKTHEQINNTIGQQPIRTFTDVGEPVELNICETSSAYESSEDVGLGTLSETEFASIKEEVPHHMDTVVEHVLNMPDEIVGDLELITVNQALVNQATHLLEESDFTTVLNQIPADEFTELFAVDRNGEYEPSREETEELERALEAVDEDVKSLEKLSQTQGLLDSLLDEHTLADSLNQIPDVFHNGYTVDNDATAHQSQGPIRALPLFQSVLHGADATTLPLAHAQAHVP